MTGSSEPKADENQSEKIATEIKPHELPDATPHIRKVIDIVVRRTMDASDAKRDQVNRQSRNPKKIDHSQQCSEDQAVREPRAMLETPPIRQPQRSQEEPSRILTRNCIQIGPKHHSAENKRESDRGGRKYAAGHGIGRRKSGHGENDSYGIVGFTAWHSIDSTVFRLVSRIVLESSFCLNR